MPPSFFNSREDASLLWAVVILAWAVYNNPRGIGNSFLALMRSFFQGVIVALFVSALLYSAAIVYGAHRVGLWHADALKATAYWFLGTGVVLIGDAVTSGSRSDADWLKGVLRRVIAVTIVIEFMVNVYALPLAFELVLVPLTLLFAGLQVVAQYDATTTPLVCKVIDAVLAGVGLIYLGYFVWTVVGDPGDLLTREKAEDLLVGPVLTVALIPFVYIVAWYSRYEQKKLHDKIRAWFTEYAGIRPY